MYDFVIIDVLINEQIFKLITEFIVKIIVLFFTLSRSSSTPRSSCSLKATISAEYINKSFIAKNINVRSFIVRRSIV